MKKITIIAALSIGLVANGQSLFNDFESGNRNVDIANCWGFGGFSVKSNNKINGSFSSRSGSINSTNGAFWMKSPWMLLGSGNLTFETKLTSNDGTRDYFVEIAFISYDANASAGEGSVFATTYTHTFTLPHSTSETVSYPVPAAIANDGNPYKVRLNFYNSSGNRNRRAIVDDWNIPGTYAADPSNSCLPISNNPDADGDGVADADDAYPNDGDRAYNFNTLGNGVFGTYAFEDLWPSKGDYDFNDLVIDYNVNLVLNANNDVVDLESKLYVRAVGGVLADGIAVHFPDVLPSNIASVTGQQLNGYTSNGANGTENGQSNAVVVIFDNVEDVINRVGGTFYNTIEGEGVGQSDSINIKISFANPVPTSSINSADLFMFKGNDRGLEIHRPDKAPTDLADLNVLGTGEDDSNPGQGRYYKTANNLPWVIELPQRFTYPVEKADIVQGYLNFAGWAQSNGSNFQDWYQDNSGNLSLPNLF